MTIPIGGFTALTGGVPGCLDYLGVTDGEMAYGIASNRFYAYQFSISSTATADGAEVIAPVSGVGRWLRRDVAGSVSNEVFGPSWNGITGEAPSKNAAYGGIESLIGDGIRRNYVINGNFDIWQRSAADLTTPDYFADRWLCNNSMATKTASRQAFTLGQTDVPNEPTYFTRHVVTTASNAAELVRLEHRFEGVRTLAGKTVTLSFYAKADSAKNIAAEFFQSFGTDGSPSASVTAIGVNKIALTTSWARYTVTATIPSISGKILGTSLNDHTVFCFWFTAGSNFNARTDSLGTQSGTFDIAKVTLIEGSMDVAPTPRSFGEELALCQRYYQTSYNVDFTTYATYVGAILYHLTIAIPASTAGAIYGTVRYPVPMRATPTVTLFARNGAAGTVYAGGAGAYRGGVTGAAYSNQRGFSGLTVDASSAVAINAPQHIEFQYTANAEL